MTTSEAPVTRIMVAVNESTIRGYPHASISSRGAFEWTLQKIVRSNASGFKLLFLHVQIPDEDEPVMALGDELDELGISIEPIGEMGANRDQMRGNSENEAYDIVSVKQGNDHVLKTEAIQAREGLMEARESSGENGAPDHRQS